MTTGQIVILSALQPLVPSGVAEALEGKYRLTEFVLPTGRGCAVLFVPIGLSPALKAWLVENVGPVADSDTTYLEPGRN